MPKDRITQSHQGYGFVEFLGEEDADGFAVQLDHVHDLDGVVRVLLAQELDEPIALVILSMGIEWKLCSCAILCIHNTVNSIT